MELTASPADRISDPPADLPDGWLADRETTDHAEQGVARRFAASRPVAGAADGPRERATVWLIDPAAAPDPEAVRRDVRQRIEALRAARLPLVLDIRDAREAPDGRLWVVEDWGGEPLTTQRPRGGLSGGRTDAALADVLRGLAALARRGAGPRQSGVRPDRRLG